MCEREKERECVCVSVRVCMTREKVLVSFRKTNPDISAVILLHESSRKLTSLVDEEIKFWCKACD